MNIAVVGAGPVGIYFTKLCLDKGYKVTLIESGNLHEESSHLNRKKYTFLSQSAIPEGVHKIGGGSTQWRGRISEFLAGDFYKIYSGREFSWPFDKTELDKYYKELYKFLKVGELSDSEVADKFFGYETESLPNDLMLRIFRFCKPDIFMSLYLSLKNHPNLEILTDCFCYKIKKNTLNNNSFLELIPKNTDSILRNFDKIVITCGTLQTTALLERSSEIYNKQDDSVLGRYLTEHIEGYIGVVKVKTFSEKEFFKKLSLNENNRALSEYEGIGAAISLRSISFKNQLNVQYEFRNLMPKPFKFAKSRNQNDCGFSLNYKLTRALLFAERIIRFILRKFRGALDTLLGFNRYSIYIKSEEIPCFDSTLCLESDSNYVLRYSHKIEAETFKLLQENFRDFEKTFNGAFDAELVFYSEIQNSHSLKDYFGPNFHPMGTTKMGLSSSDSVCSSELQVYGVNNLFLLSAAVFPTGSNTNPTFTVLALAKRLIESDHF
jgi:hypothetical protein